MFDAADGEALAQSASVVKPGVSANPGQYRDRVLEAHRARVDPDACGMHLRAEPGLIPIDAGNLQRQP